MQDILNLTIPLDIVAWNMIEYIHNGRLGHLSVLLTQKGDWICFDSLPGNDCEAYLDIVLNTVNGMLLGESE